MTRTAFCLTWLLLVSSAVAAEPKPPAPNPANPVNYIQWLNETRSGGIKENAATVYQQAYAKEKPFEGDWGTTIEQPWSDDEAVADWLAANKEALSLFRKASTMRECYFRIDDPRPQGTDRSDHLMISVLLPHLKTHRELVKGLIAEGYRSWAKGDHKTLPANMIVVIRAARHLDTGPGLALLNRLVSTASLSMAYRELRRSLSLSDEADAFAVRLLTDLGTADRPRTPISRSYSAERLILWDLCQRLFVPGDTDGTWTLHKPILKLISGVGDQQLTAAQIRTIAQAGPDAALKEINAYHDALDRWAAKPYHLAAAETGRLDRIPKTSKNALIRMMLGSITRSRVLEERIEAARRATHLIAQVLAYHGKTGVYPASLDDLQAAELKGIRVDPFSGGDFVYKLQGKSFTLYTVGENLKDDGGRHDETWEEGDYVFWPVQKSPNRQSK